MNAPRIAIPDPTSKDPQYNQRAWPQYAAAIRAAGGEPLRIPLGESPAHLARLISSSVGVLLPGSPADVNPQKYGATAIPECGPADPAREAADELLLQDAFNLYKPLLGICYGFQSMNVWRGGTLLQHLATPVNHSPGREIQHAHPIRIEAASRLHTLAAADRIDVNSSHHQAIDRPGDGLIPSAWSADDGILEAAEGHGPHFVLGVQWHPERFFEQDAVSLSILKAFLDAAAAWRPRTVQESVAP